MASSSTTKDEAGAEGATVGAEVVKIQLHEVVKDVCRFYRDAVMLADVGVLYKAGKLGAMDLLKALGVMAENIKPKEGNGVSEEIQALERRAETEEAKKELKLFVEKLREEKGKN